MTEQLPADIEAAIDAFDSAAQARGWEACMRSVAAADAAERMHAERRAALTAAILARLTAAEAARDTLRGKLDEMFGQLMLAEGSSAKLRAERDAALARAERLEAENTKLRAIISESATAIGNGACIGTECSLEFMAYLPNEIAGVMSDLRSRAALSPAPAEETKDA